MPVRFNGDSESGTEKDRFDRDAVRRILSRAAEEQHRLDRVLSDSCSLDELEEMAAEAGISPAALRAALEADRAGAGKPSGLVRPGKWLEALQALMPRSWSVPAKRAALAGLGGIGFVGLLAAFPAFGTALFWGLVIALTVFALLAAIGVMPL